MKLPFRAIVSDLDGTLLNSQHKIGDFTIQTLEKLAAKGVDIFLATGRNLPDVKHLVRKIKLEQAMLITSNGARANFLSGELLSTNYIPEAIVRALFNVPFNPTAVCLNSYQGDEWFINVDVPQLKAFHQDSGYSYQVVDFAQQHGERTEKVFYIAKTPQDLVEIEQQIRQTFGDQLQLTYSTPQCLEVMNANVCKANTLAEVVKLRGYTLADCLAFGDGMNDVEMLSQVGKGCIMRNADPRLKNALPHNEVIGHNHHESVASYLRATFGII